MRSGHGPLCSGHVIKWKHSRFSYADITSGQKSKQTSFHSISDRQLEMAPKRKWQEGQEDTLPTIVRAKPGTKAFASGKSVKDALAIGSPQGELVIAR